MKNGDKVSWASFSSALIRFKQWPHGAAPSVSATCAAPKANGANSRINVLLQGWGKKERERELINSNHTVIIMTFALILDVITTVFAACTAMMLIRMETALLINFLFAKDYLISLYPLSLNAYRQGRDHMDLTG